MTKREAINILRVLKVQAQQAIDLLSDLDSVGAAEDAHKMLDTMRQNFDEIDVPLLLE